VEHARPALETSKAPRASSVLRLAGRDALDLLHRISTTFLMDLAPGACRAAPFCDFRGRLLHRAAVAATRDGALWLLRDDAPGDELAAFVERSVFREDVRIVDQGARWNTYTAPGGGTLAPGAIEEQDGVPVQARITPEWTVALASAGARLPSADEGARIRAGRPRHGHEIHPDFTPFEVGLAHEVHLAKGCYTGQEALMRLVTYHSVRRRLVRLGGAGAAPAAPRDVRAGGTAAGRLTSVASDGARGWIGLAVLRHEAVGERIEIEGAGSVGEPAPFEITQPLGLS
jgi:folate-binding protein YgfZ